MVIQKVSVGGWFQRTTLHLSEIYDFLSDVSSPLQLDRQKLISLRADLRVKEVRMEVGSLECVHLVSEEGIGVRIYEDGLIVLESKAEESVRKSTESVASYFEKKLSPAISYIFSLGAPVPKELASIKTIYPYFVVLKKASLKDIKSLLSDFDQQEHFEIKAPTFQIFRGDTLYIINNISEPEESVSRFINEQVFLREFKVQLHRYLNLHRIIWERIAEVKEKGSIRGKDIGTFKGKVESYAKTINLIQARINQMGTYIRTRESVAKGDAELERFRAVLQFKYETLSDTLAYIKELWSMTLNYVNAALALFTSLQAKSSEASVKNLTVITSMGVGATLIGLFTTNKVPVITWFGVFYFLSLAAIGYFANTVMKKVASRRSYEIKEAGIDNDIK